MIAWMKPDRIAVAVAALSFFISTLDTGIVNVALPQIGASFHTNAAGAAQTVSWYAGGVFATILVFGWMGDRFGIRRISAIGFVAFGLFSIGCAVATSLGMLVAFRALAGVAAAMLQATAAAFVSAYVERERRPQAFATVSSILSLGPVLGPSIGGFVVTFTTWRWIFAVVLPMCAAGVYFVARLPRATQTNANGNADEARLHGWRRGLPFVSAVGLGATFMAIFVGVPFVLAHAGFAPWKTGLVLLACPLGAMIGAKTAGYGLSRGFGGLECVAGFIVCAAASVALLFVDPHAALVVAAILFFFGLGSGTLQTPTIALSLDAFPAKRRGFASALQRFVQNIAISASSEITGLLIDRTGSTGPWMFSAVTALVAALVVSPLVTARIAEHR